MWNLSDCRRAVADNARRIWGKYLALIILKLIFSRFLYCPKARKKGVSFGQIFSENRNHFGKSTHSELQIRQRESTHGKFMDLQWNSRNHIFTARYDQVWSFLNSNDQRKILGRVFVAVLEHDENCVSLYGVFFVVKVTRSNDYVSWWMTHSTYAFSLFPPAKFYVLIYKIINSIQYP